MVKQINKDDLKALFRPRPENANKGDCGRVLVIAGSYDEAGSAMCGAAYFAAAAAYRAGAGIVEIFTPRENYAPIASRLPEAVYSLCSTDSDFDKTSQRLAEQIKKSDAVVIGCGLGKSELSREILRVTLSSVNKPLIIDADGLNILSEDSSLWSFLSAEQRKRTVITPHPGEMARLLGESVFGVLADNVSVARDFSEKYGVICLLKGHRTVITDGDSVYENQSGNAGMATAGMGDVLAGIIGALAADKSRMAEAELLRLTAAAAYLHGLCGDKGTELFGEYSLMASDIIDQIPKVLRSAFIENQ